LAPTKKHKRERGSVSHSPQPKAVSVKKAWDFDGKPSVQNRTLLEDVPTCRISRFGGISNSSVKTVAMHPVPPFCDVRFSNPPVWVKRFQAIHWSAISLAGSCFSSESAPGHFHHGIRRRGGTIFGTANDNVIDLYNRVKADAKVIVLPMEQQRTLRPPRVS
jgi:hypothetical protein